MSRLILAPMEGLADDVLRGVLTQTQAYDWCVTEFIRIADTRLPQGAFTRVSPELKNGSRTQCGTLVRVQLLGSDPHMMARNAAHLARLNPAGIDLNFGCPAPLVNKHGGGAALLGEPELLEAITAAVRQAVPAAIPVTAKMRLGINDTEHTLDCARALEAGGAEELVVHARTKTDGYRPPARWEWIARIREATALPLIANGEVWTLSDYRDIRTVTGCEDVMLGRGAVADPLLASHIRQGAKDDERDWDADWQVVCGLIADFWQRVQLKLEARHAPGRFKQWLGLMRRTYPQAEALYQHVRAMRMADEVTRALPNHGISVAPSAREAA
ncbi:MAG TPA: tRNA-dihydrouridine synthase [Rhodocyclaceae bacterium]|nr:tRNA-dihydrouridine synthase [Rhodocyclaceae bacterium]